MRIQKSYCRICEAHCGLEVGIDHNNQIVVVRPDKTHPVSQGYICVKGTAIGELHHDPDRVNYPLKKVNGEWQRISWEQAITEIGGKIKAIRRRHGNRAIGHYFGNPTNFSAQSLLYAPTFMHSLGSPNNFASHSIDLNNKFHVAERMYGLLTIQPVPDFEHCHFFICFGSNPVVSQMSVVVVPNVLDKLKSIEQRGGRVIIIDPRRTETAKKVGDHYFIKPGSDAWLLMGMLHVITCELGIGATAVPPQTRAQVTGLEAFIAASRAWTPERVAPLTGIPAKTIRQLAQAYAEAEGAALYMSTGVNMGPFGSIAYWLIQGLSLLTGNLDQRGGLLFPQGPFDMNPLVRFIEGRPEKRPRTRRGNWHQLAGAFPVGALEEEITRGRLERPESSERIRALFITAGNPVHSVPGNHLAEAFDHLDLLVCIDIYKSETAAFADYLLPATDMLERSDYPLSHLTYQVTPHAQFTEAVVPPKYERKPEWWIFSRLARAGGAPFLGKTLMNSLPVINQWLEKVPGLRPFHPDDLIALLLRLGRQTTLKALKAQPQGIPLPPPEPGSFLGQRVPTRDGKINLAPQSILDDLPRLEALAVGYPADTAETLRIIGRRERRSHNSWMHNNRRIEQRRGPVALMHPEDAAIHHIEDGTLIAISNDKKTIVLPVKLTRDIMPGVLSVPHGWGHALSGQQRAKTLPGANINDVLPHAQSNMEPVSGQTIMLSHPVTVRRHQG